MPSRWIYLLVILDATGTGAPVLEMARKAMPKWPVYGVLITGGMTESYNEPEKTFYIPKTTLLVGLQAGIYSGKLMATSGLSDMGTLIHELVNYEFQVTAAGNLGFGPRKATGHDDLLLSLAIAYYGAGRFLLSSGVEADYGRCGSGEGKIAG